MALNTKEIFELANVTFLYIKNMWVECVLMCMHT